MLEQCSSDVTRRPSVSYCTDVLLCYLTGSMRATIWSCSMGDIRRNPDIVRSRVLTVLYLLHLHAAISRLPYWGTWLMTDWPIALYFANNVSLSKPQALPAIDLRILLRICTFGMKEWRLSNVNLKFEGCLLSEF